MRFFTLFALAGLAVVDLVAAAAISVDRRSVEQLEKRGPLAMAEPPIVLRPLKRRLHRRDDLSGLDPRGEDSFFYGDPDEGEQSPLASMTITMEDGRKIVSMERFEGFTRSVKCGEKMEMSFVSKEAFDYALEAWGWVNEEEDKSFVMIANHDGCGEAFERTPYRVYDVDYDEEKFIAYLFAKEMQWTEIKGEMTLDFGSLDDGPDTPDSPDAPTPIEGLTKRWGDVSNDASVSINMAKSLGSSKTIWASSVKGLDLSLDCINCGTKGKFDISGRVKVNLFSMNLKELSIQAKPKGFQARLELELTAEGVVKRFQDEKQLLSVGLPGSISIPKVFKLGASLDYDIGMTASVEGKATISYGLIGKLSDKAIVKVDIKNPSKSKFSGWAPTFETIPMKANAEISGNLAVYSQPGLSIGFNVLNKFGYEAALKMKLPEVATTLKVKTDKDGGQCGVKANKVGLNVGASVGVDLTFRVGEDKGGGKDFYSKQLFQVKRDLFNKCFGFHGSGVGDGTNGGGSGKKPKKTGEAPKKATKEPAPTKKAVPKPKKKEEKPKPKPTHPTKKPTKKTTPKATPKPDEKEKPKTTKKSDQDEKTTAKPQTTAKPKTTEKSDQDKKTTAKPQTTAKPKDNDDTEKKSTGKVEDKTETSKKDEDKQKISKSSGDKSMPISKSSQSTSKNDHTTPSSPTQSVRASSTPSTTPSTTPSSYSGSVSSPTFSASPSISSSTVSSSAVSSSPATSSIDACSVYYPAPSGSSIAVPRLDWLVAREPPPECNTSPPKITCAKSDAKGDLIDDTNYPGAAVNRVNYPKQAIKFTCDELVLENGEEKTISKELEINYYNYPSPRNAAQHHTMIEKYFDYSSPKCDNWEVTRRDKPRQGGAYQTEHVYEAQMVRDYIDYLHTKAAKKVTCTQLEILFFNRANPNEWETSGAQKLVKHIANYKFERSLYAATLLQGGINRQKASLWTTDDIIAESKLSSYTAQRLFLRIKEIGAAVHYMSQDRVKQKMACTFKAINNELDHMKNSKKFEEAKLDGDIDLKKENENYMSLAYERANKDAKAFIIKAAEAVLGRGLPLHPDDKKYMESIKNGEFSLPLLKPPTEGDAKDCGPVDLIHPNRGGDE